MRTKISDALIQMGNSDDGKEILKSMGYEIGGFKVAEDSFYDAFRAALQASGVDITTMLGEAPLAQQFSRDLFEEGVFAMALGFPTVPKGKARIRVMLSAAHSRADLDQGLAAFMKVGQKLGVIK